MAELIKEPLSMGGATKPHVNETCSNVRDVFVNGKALLMGVLSLIIFHGWCLSIEDYVSYGISTVLFFLGLFLFRKKTFQYFLCSYSLNLIFIIVLAVYFESTRGEPFIGGGDDELFYLKSIEVAEQISQGQWPTRDFWARYNSAGFIYANALIMRVAALVDSPGPITIRVVNAFMGATIAPLIYGIGMTVFPLNIARKASRSAAFCVAAFPIMIYYSSVGLRDIWIAALSVWFVYSVLLMHNRRCWIVPLMVLSGAIAVATASIRIESFAALVLFGLIIIMKNRSNWPGYLVKAFILMIILFMVLQYYDKLFLINQLQTRKLQLYADLISTEADESSLGIKLNQLRTPFKEVTKFVFALYIPVPPASRVTVGNFLIALGAVFWYLVIPFAFIGFYAGRKSIKTANVAISAFVFFTILAVSFSSIDLRHKISIYPLSILIAIFGYYHLGRTQSLVLTKWYCFLLCAGCLLYLKIKLLA